MHATHLDDQIIAARFVLGSPLLQPVAVSPRSLRASRLIADLGNDISQRIPREVTRSPYPAKPLTSPQR